MAAAGPVPPAGPGELPVSILVDYDRTISFSDVGDGLLARHGPPAPVLAAAEAEYDAGRRGSRELIEWNMDTLPRDARMLREEAAAVAQDRAFPAFVAIARGAGALVEVVSDGLGFYVASNLEALDPALADLPIATTRNEVHDGRAGVSFPYGHPDCFVCGTCKRERVRAHQASGRFVVFVGDGTSDRYAAHHADLVFAKDKLLAWMRATGRPVQPWHGFAWLAAWFQAAVANGELPRASGEVAALRRERPSAGFICGPEVWGPGRLVPPGPEIRRPGRPSRRSGRTPRTGASHA